ncbi:hypothetical protein LTR08_001993 [Meristemomyces frigidus]|nr:hypothetical protein LTR08_001993 [Meristemomyces frigidus]
MKRQQQSHDTAHPSLTLLPSASPQLRCIIPAQSIWPSGAKPSGVYINDYQGQAFDYFRRKAMIQLERNMSSAKWTQLALQLSHETPVFHAAAALGSSYRALVQVTHVAFACPSIDDTEALGQYCKAIASLRRYLDSAVLRPASLEPVLLSCLLLVMLEMIRNNSAAALSHLRFGRRLAREYMQPGSSHQLTTGTELRPQSNVITKELVSMFTQLEEDCVVSSQTGGAGFISDDLSGYCTRSLSHLSPPLMTLEDARAQFDILATASHYLRMDILQIAQSAPPRQRTGPPTSARQTCINQCMSRAVNLEHHAHLLTRLQSLTNAHSAWFTALNKLLPNLNEAGQRSTRALAILQIRHFYSAFLLSTCRETREQRSDFFSTQYPRVLCMAEQYLTATNPSSEEETAVRKCPLSPSRPGPRPNFTLDAGVLPTLFLICLKCRDSVVRRRALCALRSTDRLEGFLQSRTLATFAECIIDLEERHAKELLSSEERGGGVVLTADQVPEAARILDAVVTTAPTNPTKMHLVCGRYAHDRGGELDVVEYTGTGCPFVLHRVQESDNLTEVHPFLLHRAQEWDDLTEVHSLLRTG